MSEALRSDASQPMEQPNNDLSEVIGQLSVFTDDSNEPSTPPKNLSDMPVDVAESIIQKSDYKEQLVLRKTSKSLRTLVDKQQPACTRVEVSVMSDCIFCYYNDHRVAYIPPNWKRAALRTEFENYRMDTITTKANYEEVAFDDLASILKTSKLQLDYFSFNIDNYGTETNGMKHDDFWNWKFRSSYKKMQNILESINHQLSAKECTIDVSNYSNFMSILPYLEPGVLEKISVSCEQYDGDWREFSEEIEQVAYFEQWKQAKELQITSLIGEGFPLEYATHFKRFHCDGDLLVPNTVALIRDYILEHKNAEFCLITEYLCFELLTFENLDGIVGTRVSPNSSHYTVPDSEFYLEFMIGDDRITIEKKKKK
ncbi:unnamed protein product [Caenorhabditis brenneri]